MAWKNPFWDQAQLKDNVSTDNSNYYYGNFGYLFF